MKTNNYKPRRPRQFKIDEKLRSNLLAILLYIPVIATFIASLGESRTKLFQSLKFREMSQLLF